MDRIEKFVRKLGKERALAVRTIYKRIRVGDLVGLDVKKLRGHDSLYRVRVGKIRILYIRRDFGNSIVDVDFRNDNTY